MARTQNPAKTPKQWVFVARSIRSLPDGQEQALSCMARAEAAAKKASDWCAVARAWAIDFGDSKESLRCMDAAEVEAEDSDWFLIGDLWAEMGYPKKAIDIARNEFEPGEWSYVDSIRDSFKGKLPPGTTALDWVEPGMSLRASRDSVENAIATFGSSFTDAARCLVEAEHFAEYTRDFTRIAKVWQELLKDEDAALNAMERAAKLVDENSDWTPIARAWIDVFHNADAAAEAMVCDDAFEWIEVAKSWGERYQDQQIVVRFMEQAEARAGTLGEYAAIELAWREDFPNLDSAIRDEALQRLSAIPRMELAIADRRDREQGAVLDLGELKGTLTKIGTWTTDCNSDHDHENLARFYEFTLTLPATVTIALSSPHMIGNLYLERTSDSAYEGPIEAEEYSEDFRQMSITRTLPSGTYAVEATGRETIADFALEFRVTPIL